MAKKMPFGMLMSTWEALRCGSYELAFTKAPKKSTYIISCGLYVYVVNQEESSEVYSEYEGMMHRSKT